MQQNDRTLFSQKQFQETQTANISEHHQNLRSISISGWNHDLVHAYHKKLSPDNRFLQNYFPICITSKDMTMKMGTFHFAGYAYIHKEWKVGKDNSIYLTSK